MVPQFPFFRVEKKSILENIMLLGGLRKCKSKYIDFFRSEKMEIVSPKLFQFIELSLNLMIKKSNKKLLAGKILRNLRRLTHFAGEKQ